MRGFLEKVSRTDERTNGGELIGPISASGRGPTKKSLSQGGFQHFFGGVKIPLRGHKNFLGQNNIKNEFITIKLLREQIFSQI